MSDFALSPPDEFGGRFQSFKQVTQSFYVWAWHQECPWDGSEAAQLSRLLKASPNLDIQTFRRWLFNYSQSEDIKPGERPRSFLPRIHNYSVTPLNVYGRSVNAGTPFQTSAERIETANRAAFERAREDRQRTGANGNSHRTLDDPGANKPVASRSLRLHS